MLMLTLMVGLLAPIWITLGVLMSLSMIVDWTVEEAIKATHQVLEGITTMICNRLPNSKRPMRKARSRSGSGCGLWMYAQKKRLNRWHVGECKKGRYSKKQRCRILNIKEQNKQWQDRVYKTKENRKYYFERLRSVTELLAQCFKEMLGTDKLDHGCDSPVYNNTKVSDTKECNKECSRESFAAMIDECWGSSDL